MNRFRSLQRICAELGNVTASRFENEVLAGEFPIVPALSGGIALVLGKNGLQFEDDALRRLREGNDAGA